MKNLTLFLAIFVVAAVSGLMGTFLHAFVTALAPFAAVAGIAAVAAGINAAAKFYKQSRRDRAIELSL